MYRMGLARRRGDNLRIGLRSSRLSCSFSRSLQIQHIILNVIIWCFFYKSYLSRSLRRFRSSSSRRLLLRSGERLAGGGDWRDEWFEVRTGLGVRSNEFA